MCVTMCAQRSNIDFHQQFDSDTLSSFHAFRGLPSLIWMHAVYSVVVYELLYVCFTGVFFFVFIFQNHTHASHTLTESKDNQSISTLWGQSWETFRRTLKCVVLNYPVSLNCFKKMTMFHYGVTVRGRLPGCQCASKQGPGFTFTYRQKCRTPPRSGARWSWT